MTSENTRATTADAIPAEEAILSRDRGEVDDPIHRVSYSFRHEGSTSGSTPGSSTEVICPSTTTPPWKSTGRRWRAQNG
jgi:hypothetical protein